MKGTGGQLRRGKVVEKEAVSHGSGAAMGGGVWRAGNHVSSASKAKMNCAFMKEQVQKSKKDVVHLPLLSCE